MRLFCFLFIFTRTKREYFQIYTELYFNIKKKEAKYLCNILNIETIYLNDDVLLLFLVYTKQKKFDFEFNYDKFLFIRLTIRVSCLTF